MSLVAVLVLGACDGGSAELDPAPPAPRPSDGIFQDAELQEVVAHQIAREWEPLAALLTHQRPAVRARAALALASVQAFQAVPGLIALLDDADAGVRRDAAFALGQSAQREAGPALLATLESEEEPQVRHRILEALGKLGFDEVLSALVMLDLSGADEADRLLAISRLGALQGRVTSASMAALLAQLDSGDPRIRQAAAYFFGRAGDPSVWASHAARIREALDGYRRGDPAAIYLVRALGTLNDPEDTQRLTGLATNAPDWRVRAEAMGALAQRDLDAGAREVLMAGLDDSSVHVAVRAAEVLASLSHLPSAVGQMARWVDANPGRWQVAEPLLASLARHGEEEFVLGWLDGLDADAHAQRAAGVRALGRLRGIEALRRIRVALGSDVEAEASAAVIALRQRWGEDRVDARLHDEYFLLFSEALATGRQQAVAAAAPALAAPEFQGLGGVALLMETLTATPPEEMGSVMALLRALGGSGGEAAEAALREALVHPYQPVREVAATALSGLTGEGVEAPEGGAPPPDEEEPPTGWDPQTIDWDYLAGLGPSPRLVMETERGRMVVRLSPEEAPQTVQSMARLAQAGRFDGTPFHRVVPNFVVQGGDVGNRDGSGGAGYSIRTEITGIPYERGVIGMASAGMDTESSQFFIVHSPQPHLDGGYTAFGWVVEGADVLDGIVRGDLLLTARIE